MILVTETFKNIYGKMQDRVLFKSQDFKQADEFFNNCKSENELWLSDTVRAEILATKKCVNNE